MSEPSALERDYRRLLGWYPRSFRHEQEDEMLAVLMAGARPGQRRPGLVETADLVTGALAVRFLRAARRWRENRRWPDGLAVFSFLAPVFLVAVAIVEVAVPYHLSPYFRPSPVAPFGGLSLLRRPLFDVAVGLQLVVAAFALLGSRRMTLAAMAASALYWFVFVYGLSAVPEALQLLAAGAYILGAAALLASPGPGRGRQLVTWRHWAVLLSAAACVQAWTLTLDAGYLRVLMPQLADPSGYLVLSLVLGAVTVALAVTLGLNRSFLLLVAAMFYPYAMQLAFSPIFRPSGSGADLLSPPAPGHLAVLFAPPLLLACAVMLTAIRRRRPRAVISAGRQA
jgi:hypothetical protein